MMKNFCIISLLSLVLSMWVMGFQKLHAQYTLDEVGVNLGGGYAIYTNAAEQLGGPAVNLNGFYGHYFCGKNYGIHTTAGFVSHLPGTANGSPFLGDAAAGNTKMTFLAADLGFYLKLKLRDYHRSREWALLIGPKVNIPFVSSYSSETGKGPLRDQAESVNPVSAGLHLSMQIRRPAPDKKSWFIQPGAEFYLLPAFSNAPAGEVKPLYLFLNFGYAFWDKRG